MINYYFPTELTQSYEYCFWNGEEITNDCYVMDQPQLNVINYENLNTILNSFWFGDCMTTIENKEDTTINPLNIHEWKRTKKTLLLQTINFNKLIERLIHDLNLIHHYSDEVVIGKNKSNRSANRSFRRSRFIGVSKNGPNWQALISINKKKTYIGTYRSEVQAAKAFDFYSLLLHSVTAKTNFDYTKAEVSEMIEKFQESNDQIDNIQF